MVLKVQSTLEKYLSIVKQNSSNNFFPFMKGVNASIDDVLGTSEIFVFDEEDTAVFNYCVLNYENSRNEGLVEVLPGTWTEVEDVLRPAIDSLIQSGEENGAVSEFGGVLCACRALFALVAAMKEKLDNSQWGDISRCTTTDTSTYRISNSLSLMMFAIIDL